MKNEYYDIDWGSEEEPASEPVVDIATAKKDFYWFMKKNYLKMKFKKSDKGGFEAFEGHREIILDAIMRGSLTFDENSMPTYTPVDSPGVEPIKFYKPKGSFKAAIDKAGKNSNIGAAYAMLAILTNTFPALFANSLADKPDLEVCMAIEALFLA